MQSDVKIITTARAIIVKDNKLLLVQSRNDDFWHTPGGWLDGFETLTECCKREVYEELGLVIEPIRLLYISEIHKFATDDNTNIFNDNLHKIEHFFYCTIMDGKIDESTTQNQWVDEDNALIQGVQFIKISELSEFKILPSWLKERDILYDISHNVCEYISD